MKKMELTELLSKYKANRCTDEEIDLLNSWYNDFEIKNLPPLTKVQLQEINSMQPPIAKHKATLILYILVGLAAILALTIVSLAGWLN